MERKKEIQEELPTNACSTFFKRYCGTTVGGCCDSLFKNFCCCCTCCIENHEEGKLKEESRPEGEKEDKFDPNQGFAREPGTGAFSGEVSPTKPAISLNSMTDVSPK